MNTSGNQVVRELPTNEAEVYVQNHEMSSIADSNEFESVRQPVIILQHIVPEYQEEFGNETYVESVINYLQTNNFFVILTLPRKASPAFDQLKPFVHRTFLWELLHYETTYDAAYELGGEPDDYVMAGTDGTARIYNWIKPLVKLNAEIFVAGGHRNQCLDGLLRTLEHIGAKYKVVEHLVYPAR